MTKAAAHLVMNNSFSTITSVNPNVLQVIQTSVVLAIHVREAVLLAPSPLHSAYLVVDLKVETTYIMTNAMKHVPLVRLSMKQTSIV